MKIHDACVQAALHTPKQVASGVEVMGIAFLALSVLSALRGSPLPNSCISVTSGLALMLTALWILKQHQTERAVKLDLSAAHPHILRHIFSFFDLASLKNFALTSRKWHAVAMEFPEYWKPIAMGKRLSQTRDDVQHELRSLAPIMVIDNQVKPKAPYCLPNLPHDGTVCVLEDQTRFPCPEEPATTVCLNREDVYLGSSSGMIRRCTRQGEVKERWKLYICGSIESLHVDGDYLVANTDFPSVVQIVDRQKPNEYWSIGYLGKLNGREIYMSRGLLFFFCDSTLWRVDLKGTTRQTYDMPQMHQPTFLGVWNRVAFFTTETGICLVHYPSSTIINQIGRSHHYFFNHAIVENDRCLKFYIDDTVWIYTYTWNFYLREGPTPELLGSFAPLAKEQTVADLETPQTCTLWRLPDLLLLTILQFLDRSSLSRTSSTCTRLRKLSQSDALWQGRLGVYPSSYHLHWGLVFLGRSTPIPGESPVVRHDIYTSLFSSHCIYVTDELDTTKTTGAFQIDEGLRLESIQAPCRWPYHSQGAALYGTLMSYAKTRKEAYILDIATGISHPLENPSQNECFTYFCQDACYTYVATFGGKMLRYTLGGQLDASISFVDESHRMRDFYADSSHLACISRTDKALQCTWSEHRDFVLLEATKGMLIFSEEMPLHWYLNHEALFYQFQNSYLYVYFFHSKTFQKIPTDGEVCILHTQGDVVLTSQRGALVLFNYRTGSLLRTLPTDLSFTNDGVGAKLRGSEISAVSDKKTLQIQFRL